MKTPIDSSISPISYSLEFCPEKPAKCQPGVIYVISKSATSLQALQGEKTTIWTNDMNGIESKALVYTSMLQSSEFSHNEADAVIQALKAEYILPMSADEFKNKLETMDDEKLLSKQQAVFKYILKEHLEQDLLQNVAHVKSSNATIFSKSIQGNTVCIEQIGPRILVRVEPYVNLIGVPCAEQKDRINQLVNTALNEARILTPYKDIYVSACVGVQGIGGGAHANAFVKCAGEDNLSQWEPRNGPQLYSNDTICAMVIATATAQFEHGVRQGFWNDKNAAYAEQQTLRHERLTAPFRDRQLLRAKANGALYVIAYGICLVATSLFRAICNLPSNVKTLLTPTTTEKVHTHFDKIKDTLTTMLEENNQTKTSAHEINPINPSPPRKGK